MKRKIGGRTRKIYHGKKGGMYYISKGEKRYVSAKKGKKK